MKAFLYTIGVFRVFLFILAIVTSQLQSLTTVQALWGYSDGVQAVNERDGKKSLILYTTAWVFYLLYLKTFPEQISVPDAPDDSTDIPTTCGTYNLKKLQEDPTVPCVSGPYFPVKSLKDLDAYDKCLKKHFSSDISSSEESNPKKILLGDN